MVWRSPNSRSPNRLRRLGRASGEEDDGKIDRVTGGNKVSSPGSGGPLVPAGHRDTQIATRGPPLVPGVLRPGTKGAHVAAACARGRGPLLPVRKTTRDKRGPHMAAACTRGRGPLVPVRNTTRDKRGPHVATSGFFVFPPYCIFKTMINLAKYMVNKLKNKKIHIAY